MAEIVLEKLSKVYADGTEAVKGMDLEIRDGEFIILVGPSGCGKSTALRMIAGLEDISGGELRIGDKVVNDLPPRERDIAMVFQNYALYPHMSVRENMGFALKLAKEDEEEINRRVENAADILDLTEHLDRKPANLSGGQRQRVAMGRAIVRDPAAFLMDEPLSNLDAKLRVQMRFEVSRLQNRLGTTTVYVTHDQTEAMTLGDRVAVMRGGELQQVGTPQELYEEPTNLFVAGFIGSPSMNFLTGELDGDQLRLPMLEATLPEDRRAELGDRREVFVGIRPEHFQDAALVGEESDRGVTFRAEVDLLEPMGSEIYAHFTVASQRMDVPDLRDLATDAGQEENEAGESEVKVVARLDAGSRVRQGESGELWLDMSRLYFFDPEDGSRLSAREQTAAA